ncbi:MAG: hypothetical protein GY874_14225 [Desulfobacteraceae bacterium]|nr:hypothetical protein [Desulfobacteraceae bacterium]
MRAREKMFFVLGPQTPQVDKIEQLLKAADILHTYAKYNGERVDKSTALQADSVEITVHMHESETFWKNSPVQLSRHVYLVECSPESVIDTSGVFDQKPHLKTISYQIADARGCNKYPSDFMWNSLIGNVIEDLACAMATVEFLEMLECYTQRSKIALQFDFKNFFDPGRIFFHDDKWQVRLRDGFVEVPEDIVCCAAADLVYAGNLVLLGVDQDKLEAFKAVAKNVPEPRAMVA